VLTVNASEYELRQRFSVLHEFKHVIDHTVRHLILGDKKLGLTAEAMAEKVADYFAACVLMPKTWVKRAFFNEGIHSTEALAELFHVSPKAMSVRLSQLGLARQADRCGAADLTFITRAASAARTYWPQGAPRRRGRYFRALPLPSPSSLHLAIEGVRT
jgi:Zn-dependent peptidase ImmA (M78 family)